MFIINIQCLVIIKTIIPFTLVGYELMIADSVLLTSTVSTSLYRTHVRGIIIQVYKASKFF